MLVNSSILISEGKSGLGSIDMVSFSFHKPPITGQEGFSTGRGKSSARCLDFGIIVICLVLTTESLIFASEW